MQISRLQLYELVSQTPLSKLAPSLGTSAIKLEAVCREHRVPYSGSTYWTRKSMGLSGALEPLPESQSLEQTINIPPATKRLRPTSAEAKDGVPEFRSTQPALALAALTRKPHPIIAKWLAEHEQRRREAIASRDPWKIRSAPTQWSELDHRRHRILNLLFNVLESRGARISDAPTGLICVAIDNEKIEFQLREKQRQVNEASSSGQRSYPSHKLVGTGKLVFTIRTYLRKTLNEEWRETDSRPLESRIHDFADRLFEGARILRDWHIEQEEERERWRQEAARRPEQERRAKQELSRRKRLRELASDLQSANQIRELLAVFKLETFEGGKCVHGRPLAEWMSWAEDAANTLDPTRGGAGELFSIIGLTGSAPAGSD